MPNTKTKPQPTEPVEPVVRFKMLRNVMLFDLSPYMGGSHPAIPMQMKEERSIQVPAYVEEPTSDGYTRMRMGTKSPVQPTFDLSHTFTIPLEPIDPRPIVKTEGMSEAWFEKLQDREYERALASRERQENLRRLLKHYAKHRFRQSKLSTIRPASSSKRPSIPT